jgi:hypothetical protein
VSLGLGGWHIVRPGEIECVLHEAWSEVALAEPRRYAAFSPVAIGRRERPVL